MSENLQAATVSLERRIAEIDRLLTETDALRAEREHLARALEEVAAATSATGASADTSSPQRVRSRKRAARSRGASDTARRATRASSGTRKRAPEGANRERIVSFLRDNGAAGASTIAKGTGIHRGVVYNNLSKLADDNTVTRNDAGGTTRFELSS